MRDCDVSDGIKEIGSFGVLEHEQQDSKLQEIKQFPLKINWNRDGLARLNGHYMNNSIQDLIGLCFYSIRHKKIECLSLWYNVLKECNLTIFVTN